MTSDGNHPPQGSSRLLAVGIGTYREPHAPLDEAPKAAKRLADLFAAVGYVLDHPELHCGGFNSTQFNEVIPTWFTERDPSERVVLYWCGHSEAGLGTQLLITSDTPDMPRTWNAIEAKVLAELLVGCPASHVLIMLDTCYSGQSLIEAGRIMDAAKVDLMPERGKRRRIALMTSSHALQKAVVPIFADAVTRVLSDTYSGEVGWGAGDRYIDIRAFVQAVRAVVAPAHVDLRAWEARDSGWAEAEDTRDWLENPAWSGRRPDEIVELLRELDRVTVDRATAEHLDASARGLEAGSSGWSFTGRTATLRAITTWLNQTPQGVLVVTGPPGAGKSAVVGRVVTMSVPAYRERAKAAGLLIDAEEGTLPEPGTFQAAIHAKNRTTLECVHAIAAQLGIDLDEAAEQPAYVVTEHLLNALDERAAAIPVTIAVDALDEAGLSHRDAIANLCQRLGDRPGVRVVVGVRYSVTGEHVPVDRRRLDRLRSAFAGAAIVDLADDAGTEDDLARYVDRRLAEKHGASGARRRFARDAAVRAVANDGLFLYARIVARTVAGLDTLPADLPAGVEEAFVQDLLSRFAERKDRYLELLAPLAWGKGKGLPKEIWARIATALSVTGASYGVADVNEVLREAGWHIIEATEDDRTVYRLSHALLTEYFQAQVRPRERVECPWRPKATARCRGEERG